MELTHITEKKKKVFGAALTRQKLGNSIDGASPWVAQGVQADDGPCG